VRQACRFWAVAFVGRVSDKHTEDTRVKYMLLINDDPAAGPSNPAEGQKVLAEYGAFTEAIMASKELVAGDRLRGVDAATSVRVRGGKTSATDGPFAETKEHLGGFYIVDVADLDRAIELAAKIPAARTGVVEVRPLWPMGEE
jgi:hypothetical protein